MPIVSSRRVDSIPEISYAWPAGWMIRDSAGRLQPSSTRQIDGLFGPEVASLAVANSGRWIAIEPGYTPATQLAGGPAPCPLLVLEVQRFADEWEPVGFVDSIVDGQPVTIAVAEEVLAEQAPFMGDARRRLRVLAA